MKAVPSGTRLQPITSARLLAGLCTTPERLRLSIESECGHPSQQGLLHIFVSATILAAPRSKLKYNTGKPCSRPPLVVLSASPNGDSPTSGGILPPLSQ